MTTAVDGSKFWLIEKTFSKGGDGPAGIWESPDFSSLESFAATNVVRYNDVCVRSKSSGWKCRPETAMNVHPALTIHSLVGAGKNASSGSNSSDGNSTMTMTVYNVFMAKVNEVENPYPDCTREEDSEQFFTHE